MQFYYARARWGGTHDDCRAVEKYLYRLKAKILKMISGATMAVTHSLPLVEAFYTIQGEGYHQGKAAYFIRLGGCDVGCVWCDVKDSWDVGKHPLLKIEDLIFNISETPAELVVITGGEPLMHDLGELTKELQQAGFKTHIETSGAYPLSGSWDWIC